MIYNLRFTISGQIKTQFGSTIIRVLKGGCPIPKHIPFSDAAAAILSDMIKKTDWPDGVCAVVAKVSVAKGRRRKEAAR